MGEGFSWSGDVEYTHEDTQTTPEEAEYTHEEVEDLYQPITKAKEITYPAVLIKAYNSYVVDNIKRKLDIFQEAEGVIADTYITVADDTMAISYGTTPVNYYLFQELRQLGVEVQYYLSKGEVVNVLNVDQLIKEHPELFNAKRYSNGG